MGRALVAVGTFLALCMAVFGSVVYFTRDEDTFAVDNLLSERITREVATQDQVDLRAVTGFDFDEVLVFPPGTERADISEALGFEFHGDLRYTAESSLVFVFTNRGRFVRFADYRGRSEFTGLEPLQTIPANDAVFSIRNGVVRLG